MDNYLKLISNYKIRYLTTPSFLIHIKAFKKLIRMLHNKNDYVKTRNHFLKVSTIFNRDFIIQYIKDNYFSFIFDAESEEIFSIIVKETECTI